MDVSQRIAQFENMVREGADPTNDMAWFSLGSAYAQAERHADAAKAFARCVELNPGMSKAWQLAGKAFMDAQQNEKAVAILTEGYSSAAQKGDFMPQKAMADMLAQLGAAVPEVAKRQTLPPGKFMCQRTGKPGTKLGRPPFKGPVGLWIRENISKETFEDWIKQGTKVINELRLDLSREQDEETYDRHMREYLGVDDDLYARLSGGTSA